MDEQNLRRALAKQLRRKDVPPPLWKWLKDGRYLNEFWENLSESGSKEEAWMKALKTLSKEASRLLRLCKEISAYDRDSNDADKQATLNPEPGSDLLGTDIDPYVIERNEAISVYHQRLAEDNAEVRNFRAIVLGNQILSPDQVKAFLESEATQCICIYCFLDLGIPFIGHQSKVISEENYLEYKMNIDKVLSKNPNFNQNPQDIIGKILITWDDRSIILEPGRCQDTMDYVRFRCIHDDKCRDKFYAYGAFVRRRSVLALLQYTGGRLAASTLWSTDEAIWFILTHECPSIIQHPIGHTVYKSTRQDPCVYYMKLTIEPWVPAKAVERYYRKHQRTFLKKHLYRHNSKLLKLFEFVQQEKGLSWNKLWQRWNNEYPDESYSDMRNFWKAYKRIEKTLLFPYLDSIDNSIFRTWRKSL